MPLSHVRNPLEFSTLAEALEFVRSHPGYGWPTPNRLEDPDRWLVPRNIGLVDERLAAEARPYMAGLFRQDRRRR